MNKKLVLLTVLAVFGATSVIEAKKDAAAQARADKAKADKKAARAKAKAAKKTKKTKKTTKGGTATYAGNQYTRGTNGVKPSTTMVPGQTNKKPAKKANSRK